MLYLFLKDHKSELSTEIDTLIPIMVKGYFITACDMAIFTISGVKPTFGTYRCVNFAIP